MLRKRMIRSENGKSNQKFFVKQKSGKGREFICPSFENINNVNKQAQIPAKIGFALVCYWRSLCLNVFVYQKAIRWFILIYLRKTVFGVCEDVIYIIVVYL